MRIRPVIGTALAVGLFAAPAAQGARFVDGSPDFAKLRGKPTTIMFFHPL